MSVIRSRLIAALLLACLLTLTLPTAGPAPAHAQGLGDPVTLEASDGLSLSGLYLAPAEADDDGAPAALLMHHSGSQKEAWIDLIPVLHAAGFHVLSVDLRGHGQTGGDIDWPLAEDDAARWLQWLREQPGVDPDRVSIVGASIGADLGLRVMANDPDLRTLVGLSVGLNVQGVGTEAPVEAMGPRPLFLVATQGVPEERDAVLRLMSLAQGDVQMRLYNNTSCCTFLVLLERDLADAIVDWLAYHSR